MTDDAHAQALLQTAKMVEDDDELPERLKERFREKRRELEAKGVGDEA